MAVIYKVNNHDAAFYFQIRAYIISDDCQRVYLSVYRYRSAKQYYFLPFFIKYAVQCFGTFFQCYNYFLSKEVLHTKLCLFLHLQKILKVILSNVMIQSKLLINNGH